MAGPARLAKAKAGDGVIVAVPDNIGRSDREPQPAGLRRPARLFEIMRGLEVLASPPQPPGKFPS
jgi:hypothetical protein